MINAQALADALYRAGFNAAKREQDYDPRSCAEWQKVVDALTAIHTEQKRT